MSELPQTDEIEKESLFSVYAYRKGDTKPLIQINMTFGRLMEDIVIPFNTDEMFFLDGAPMKATSIDRIKLIRQGQNFARRIEDLHFGMRRGDIKLQELYAKQYDVRLEAILRDTGEDVTSQIIKAYTTAVKPKLKDYMSNRESILDAAVKVFTESLKALGWGLTIRSTGPIAACGQRPSISFWAFSHIPQRSG